MIHTSFTNNGLIMQLTQLVAKIEVFLEVKGAQLVEMLPPTLAMLLIVAIGLIVIWLANPNRK